MTTYRIEGEPTFVGDAPEAPLPGHHEARFVGLDGVPILRYLTDKGRAEVLRTIDDGHRALTREEFERHTVEPDLDALVRRMEREAGEGA
jgi:hypothetical protein